MIDGCPRARGTIATGMVRPELRPIARLMLAGKAPEEIARATGTDVRLVRAWCSSPLYPALAEETQRNGPSLRPIR
jgi:hypothetical protein